MIRAAQARAARKRYRQIAPVLNEQSRRRFVALEAQALGRGGVSLMARITGLARSTIYHGLSDIRNNVAAAPGRIRKAGGGRKKKTLEDPTLLGDLKALVEPVTRGDPMRSLLCRSSSMVSKVLTHSRFSFKVRMKRSATPLPSGCRTKEGEASIPRHSISSWKSPDM